MSGMSGKNPESAEFSKKQVKKTVALPPEQFSPSGDLTNRNNNAYLKGWTSVKGLVIYKDEG